MHLILNEPENVEGEQGCIKKPAKGEVHPQREPTTKRGRSEEDLHGKRLSESPNQHKMG
jgi:hypothetical protein